MSHEAITEYLESHNAATEAGEPIPNMYGRLTDTEADRVTRFLKHATPQRLMATGRTAVRRTTTPVTFEVTTGSIDSHNLAILQGYAASLEAPIQEGER